MDEAPISPRALRSSDFLCSGRRNSGASSLGRSLVLFLSNSFYFILMLSLFIDSDALRTRIQPLTISVPITSSSGCRRMLKSEIRYGKKKRGSTFNDLHAYPHNKRSVKLSRSHSSGNHLIMTFCRVGVHACMVADYCGCRTGVFLVTSEACMSVAVNHSRPIQGSYDDLLDQRHLDLIDPDYLRRVRG